MPFVFLFQRPLATKLIKILDGLCFTFFPHNSEHPNLLKGYKVYCRHGCTVNHGSREKGEEVGQILQVR
jgi:hypothetical protein